MSQSGRQEPDDVPMRRVVLLGASNLVRGISTVVAVAQKFWGQPLDVLAAHGHGRSYGMQSRVLMRGLPGITSCGLWTALGQRPAAATAALVTDIGNDILYGAGVDQIAAWVDQCLAKLRPVSQRIVVTELPIASLEKLGPRRFAFMRRVIFPSAKLRFEDAISRAEQLNERVKQLAVAHDAALIQPRSAWFGIDPIHIKLHHWSAAWQEFLASWRDDRDELPLHIKSSLARWLVLRRLRPERRWMFGLQQRRKQPAKQLNDGTLISFY